MALEINGGGRAAPGRVGGKPRRGNANGAWGCRSMKCGREFGHETKARDLRPDLIHGLTLGLLFIFREEDEQWPF
ncbi:hypothetical protein CDL15_Pgr024098 [Punica granatum]|nr:hypothetical protein CDL15_Pgr024098 [Punica granatum]